MITPVCVPVHVPATVTVVGQAVLIIVATGIVEDVVEAHVMPTIAVRLMPWTDIILPIVPIMMIPAVRLPRRKNWRIVPLSVRRLLRNVMPLAMLMRKI